MVWRWPVALVCCTCAFPLIHRPLLPSATGRRINTFAGPFEMIFRQMDYCPKEICDDRKRDVEWFARATRDRKLKSVWHVDGNVTTGIEVTKNLEGSMSAASWSSRGGWKENAHHMKFGKVCDALNRYVPSLYNNIKLSVFGTKDIDCPYPPGTYIFKNITTEVKLPPTPVFFYGKWRNDFIIYDPTANRTVFCMRICVDTVPKN